jgi:hypothetical protein
VRGRRKYPHCPPIGFDRDDDIDIDEIIESNKDTLPAAVKMKGLKGPNLDDDERRKGEQNGG